MAAVHGSAVVDPAARLADGVEVGPLVVIEADVEVGPGSVLLPGTVLLNGARVGARCRLGPYASVGGRPEDRAFTGERSYAVLEDDVEIRDFGTVHRATGEDAETRVGTGSLLMSYAHVSHNGRVGQGATLTNLVQLGGHVEIGDGAVLGAGAMVHQFGRIGRLAILGAGGRANRDVLPYSMARGDPARHYRSNAVGLTRAGLDARTRDAIQSALRCLRRRDREGLEALAQDSREVAEIARFVAESRRGVSAFRSAS